MGTLYFITLRSDKDERGALVQYCAGLRVHPHTCFRYHAAITTYILVQRLKRINSYAGIVRIRYEGVLSALHKIVRGHPYRPYLSAKL